MPEIFGAALMGGGSGPAFAAIGAIYPAGATCTCSYGGKTITAKDTSGRALFLVPSAGQWLVKASNGGQDVEDTVSITTQGQVASVTLAVFSATIQATFPADCTSVTCTKDSTILSVPSGSLSSGSYTFDIPEPGDWALYATNGVKDKTITVNVTEEIAYTAALTFELVLFDNGEYAEETGGWHGIKNSKLEASSRGKENVSYTISPWYSNQAIDFTNFSTLKFDVDFGVIGEGDVDETSSVQLVVGLTTEQNKATTTPSKMTAKKTASKTPGINELDVSNINGSYHITGITDGGMWSSVVKITRTTTVKVWLE